MKATLEFLLPDEIEEFKYASNAWNLHRSIYKIKDLIRDIEKYGKEFTVEELIREIKNRYPEDL